MAGANTPAAPGKEPIPRWLKVAGIIVALVLLVIIVITLIPLPLEGMVRPDSRNGQVYAALAANGIPDAAVDMTKDRLLVSARVTNAADAPKVKYIVWGAASQVANPPPVIIVEVFSVDTPAGTNRVETASVQDYVAGKITLDELEKRVQAS